MPIVASDIVVYGSASMPDDDTPTGIGGAISTTKRVVFVDMVVNDTVGAFSSAAGDTTQTLTVTGRNTAGAIVSDTISMNGITKASTIQVFERILKLVFDIACVGNVTVEDNTGPTNIATMEIGLLEIRRPFYNALAEASGGSNRDYYEKVFFKNDHATLTLSAATIAEQADPSGKVTFALESTLNGSDTNGAGNRQTHTGGYTFNDSTKNVANAQNHTAAAGQGVWLKLTLTAGDAANNTSYTLRESGTTV